MWQDYDGWGLRIVECPNGHRAKRVIPIAEGERFTFCRECNKAQLLKVCAQSTNNETRG